MSGPHADVVTAVAGFGLDGAVAGWPSAPLSEEGWQRLTGVAFRQRVHGLLAAAVAAEDMPVTDAQHADITQRHRDAMAGVLRLESRLLDAAGVLAAAGIAFRVLKGSAAAHLDYPDPAMRVFGDVDLLVPSPRVGDAIEALAALGAGRRRPSLGHGFDERFAKSVELVCADGVEIDLHRTLALEPFGIRIDEESLHGDPEPFDLGGRTLPALGLERRFLHACYHACLGNYPVRLVPLRDLASIATRDDLDVEVVIELAARWWARAVVADGVARAWALFGLPSDAPLARWAASYRPSRREDIALAAFQRPDRRQAHRTVATLRTLPGVRNRARYLRALLRPHPDYLASRGLRGGQWLRRGRAALGGRRRT